MDYEARRRVVDSYESNRATYDNFADALRVLAGQLLRDEGLVFDGITARAKEPPSLLTKLSQRPEYKSLQDVPDLVGVRIVTRYAADVEEVCRLLRSEFTIFEEIVHGSEAADAFGYTSRHLVLKLAEPRSKLREWKSFSELTAEFQVRSILQHAWASISHGLDYKTDVEVPAEVRRRLFRVAALLETGDEIFDGFKGEIAQIRSDYETEASQDQWRDLPLNLDSIMAAVQRLPLREAVTVAVEEGWRSDETIEQMADGWITPELLSRVVAVSRAAGLDTVGALFDLMMRAIEDRDWLRRLCEAGGNSGYVPWAVPTDVAALRCVSESPASAAELEGTIVEALIETAKANPPSPSST